MIRLNENDLTQVIRKIITEITGESQNEDSINFLRYLTYYFTKLYGKDMKHLVYAKISAYEKLIDKYDLKTAKEMFDDYKGNSSGASASSGKINKFFNKPQEWVDTIQSQYKPVQSNRTPRLDDLHAFEARKVSKNMDYMFECFFKKKKTKLAEGRPFQLGKGYDEEDLRSSINEHFLLDLDNYVNYWEPKRSKRYK